MTVKNGPPPPKAVLAPLALDVELARAANDNATPDPQAQPAQRFRVVIEDEETGQEFVGWGGITRTRADLIADFIDERAVPEVKIGRLARRPAFLFGRLARGRK